MYKVSKPPIWRDANRLLLEIEQAVRCSPAITNMRRAASCGVRLWFCVRGFRAPCPQPVMQGYFKGGLKRRVLDRAMINHEAGCIAST